MATIYVLDTNVVSELIRPQADVAVLQRLASLDDSAWCITSMTEAELRHGLAMLPAGRKKQHLEVALQGLLLQDFAGRILAFDSAASVYYAQCMVARARMGRPLQVQDAMIAACCLAHVATLVTRNIKDFEGLGLELLNPWE